MVLTGVIFGQDTTISQAFKFNAPSQTYKLSRRFRFPSHPLVSSYYLVEEAKKGNPLAEHELGLRYLLGEGFEADTARAVFWIYKAAQSKLPPACFNMGLLLNQGIGVDWDPFSAYDYFKCAAKLGMPAAEYIFGVLHSYTMIVNKNLNETYKWVKLSAQQGFKPAIELLKQLRRSGINFEENAETETDTDTTNTSSEYVLMDDNSIKQNFGVTPISNDSLADVKSTDKEKLQKFFSSSPEKIKEKIGFVKSNVKDTTKSDTTNGFNYIKNAAEAGSPEAMLLLGKAYELGVDVPKDTLKAMVYYIWAYRLGGMRAWSVISEKAGNPQYFENLKKQIDKENTDAMYIWANMRFLGFNFQITDNQAVEMLNKSAKLNHIPSLIEAGKIYFSGKFAEKDTAKAFAYWRSASKLGSIEAKVRLTFTKLNNIATSKKVKSKALAYLKKVANEGSILAQSLLGVIYEKGIGVKANKGKAAEYYRLAASRGNEAAYFSLRKMYDEIRPPDREEFKIYDENY